ncbi:unnamed protein product [Moneuplotes crassus]|uniref:Uncharacterized protein n=2 Tax=Euplotes crassus TaxID=5936 RepID=A0AAD1UGU7_EUPCR|nr:unnamed protein product [Moneuplotes crassus]
MAPSKYMSKYGNINDHEYSSRMINKMTTFYSKYKKETLKGRNDKLEIIKPNSKFKSLSPSPLGHFDHSSIMLNFCENETIKKEMFKNIKNKKRINNTIHRYYAQHFQPKRSFKRSKNYSTVDARLNELDTPEFLERNKKKSDVFLMTCTKVSDPKKWRKMSTSSQNQYSNLIDDYKKNESKNMKFNPKFGMMNMMERKKERELQYPEEFGSKLHYKLHKPKYYNLLNKPWSPKPGKSPIIQNLQKLILNGSRRKKNTIKKKQAKQSDLHEKSSDFTNTGTEPKCYTQNPRFGSNSGTHKEIRLSTILLGAPNKLNSFGSFVNSKAIETQEDIIGPKKEVKVVLPNIDLK